MTKFKAFFILGLIGFLGAWVSIFTSEYYEYAKNFIRADAEVEKRFGPATYLILTSYKISYGDVDQARLRFYLIGDKTSGSIEVRVIDKEGTRATTIKF